MAINPEVQRAKEQLRILLKEAQKAANAIDEATGKAGRTGDPHDRITSSFTPRNAAEQTAYKPGGVRTGLLAGAAGVYAANRGKTHEELRALSNIDQARYMQGLISTKSIPGASAGLGPDGKPFFKVGGGAASTSTAGAQTAGDMLKVAGNVVGTKLLGQKIMKGMGAKPMSMQAGMSAIGLGSASMAAAAGPIAVALIIKEVLEAGINVSRGFAELERSDRRAQMAYRLDIQKTRNQITGINIKGEMMRDERKYASTVRQLAHLQAEANIIAAVPDGGKVANSYRILKGGMNEEAKQRTLNVKLGWNQELEATLTDEQAWRLKHKRTTAAFNDMDLIDKAWTLIDSIKGGTNDFEKAGMEKDANLRAQASLANAAGVKQLGYGDMKHARRRFKEALNLMDNSEGAPYMWRHPEKYFAAMESARMGSRNWGRSQMSRAKNRTGD